MKSQESSKTEALGPNYIFKDGMAEYFTVYLNKCTLRQFTLLGNNLDIYFAWKHCILMIIF